MSQFTPPPDQPFPAAYGQPAKTSGLAITSLVSSLIFCCPVTTLLGIVLGLAAFFTIGSNPAKKGKGLAITAIVLGVVFTGGQYFAGKWAYANFYEIVLIGPRDALSAGMGGDVAAFKGWFHGPGATATDAEARAFLEELNQRYGGFVSAKFDQQAAQGVKQPAPGQANVPFPYVLTFQNATVNSETEIIFADPSAGPGFLKKLGYIKIFDPDRGDLEYPPPSAPSVGAP